MIQHHSRLTIDLDSDGVATVTMCRPPVNGVGLLMYHELFNLFIDIDQIGPGVRAVVLTESNRVIDTVVAWGDPDAIAARVPAHTTPAPTAFASRC